MADDAPAFILQLARALDAELVETHISWVLLAPELAYKLKKPVRLPFVDYSTLERRRHCCEEEVRLNRALAPTLYLDVARITGTPEAPAIDGPGPAFEYAVRMKRFPPGALFCERLQAGALDPAAVDRFAQRLADFHAKAPAASPLLDADGMRPLRRAQAALAGAQPLFDAPAAAALARWLEAEWDPALRLQRLREGRVREGHGDLHLANVVALEADVAAFDCIEFDPALRSRDLVDDAAFALMDFAARGRADLGWRFFNAWLEHTGDYEGIALLRFWLVSHALVRAQVERLRGDEAAARSYAQAASGWTRPPAARLFITSGLPGSGKTFASQRALERTGAVRIRSDVERKRLLGLPALADTRALGVDAYTTPVTERTYARLLALARIALRAGFPVVLDAAFLRRDERARAQALARELQLPFSILSCEAPLEVLRARLSMRTGDASEADVAVLERLRAAAEPLTPEEREHVVELAAGSPR